MNNVTSFLVVAAAIFAVITLLLVVMSHLEARQGENEMDKDRE